MGNTIDYYRFNSRWKCTWNYKYRYIFDGWWTLFIIIPCFIGLFKEREKTGNFIGFLIGIALLLCCQDVLNFDMIWKLAFPLILIIIGIFIIFKDTFDYKLSKEIKKMNEKK